MNLTHLKYFQTVARMEHYSEAAKVLYISQPSLSSAMTKLEDELGVALFSKTGRNIRLTESGKVFLEYVNEALDILEKGVSRVRALSGEAERTVAVGSLFNLGKGFLPTLINSFIEEKGREDLKFQIVQDSTYGMLKDLQDEKLDLILSSYPENCEDVLYVPIYEEELVLTVPKDHWAAGRSEISLEELKAETFVLHNSQTGVQRIVRKMFDAINVTPEISMEAELDTTLCGFVEAGFGVSIMAHSKDIERFDIKIVKLVSPVAHRFIYLCWKKGRPLSRTAAAFRSFISARCNLEPIVRLAESRGEIY